MSRTVLPGGDENRRGSCLGCGAGRVRAAQCAAKPEGSRFIHMGQVTSTLGILFSLPRKGGDTYLTEQ